MNESCYIFMRFLIVFLGWRHTMTGNMPCGFVILSTVSAFVIFWCDIYSIFAYLKIGVSAVMLVLVLHRSSMFIEILSRCKNTTQRTLTMASFWCCHTWYFRLIPFLICWPVLVSSSFLVSTNIILFINPSVSDS